MVKEKKIDFKRYNDDYIFNELIYHPTLSYDQSCDKIINDIIDRNNLDEAKNNDKILTTLKECINEIKTSRVLNVYDNPVAKGDVNQLKRVTQLVDVHFNSCFRENYYESNPTDFSYAIPNGGMINVVSMKLLSIEIPNCWFLFSSSGYFFSPQTLQLLLPLHILYSHFQDPHSPRDEILCPFASR